MYAGFGGKWLMKVEAWKIWAYSWEDDIKICYIETEWEVAG